MTKNKVRKPLAYLKLLLDWVFEKYAEKVFSERIFSLYVKRKCKDEYQNQIYILFNERSVEYSFVFRQLAAYCPVDILDVGTGTTALPHLMRTCGFKVTAIDNVKDYWPEGMTNRHFHVLDDDITNSKLEQKFDLITCISTLEHIIKSEDAIYNMFNLLKTNGKLVLTFPYNEHKYCENVYRLPNSSVKLNTLFVAQAFSRVQLIEWCERNNGVIVEQEYWRFFNGDFWSTNERLTLPEKVTVNDRHQITCLVISKKNS